MDYIGDTMSAQNKPHSQTEMFIIQAAVQRFTCMSHIFPEGLFVCLKQSEADFPADGAARRRDADWSARDHTLIFSD